MVASGARGFGFCDRERRCLSDLASATFSTNQRGYCSCPFANAGRTERLDSDQQLELWHQLPPLLSRPYELRADPANRRSPLAPRRYPEAPNDVARADDSSVATDGRDLAKRSHHLAHWQ